MDSFRDETARLFAADEPDQDLLFPVSPPSPTATGILSEPQATDDSFLSALPHKTDLLEELPPETLKFLSDDCCSTTKPGELADNSLSSATLPTDEVVNNPTKEEAANFLSDELLFGTIELLEKGMTWPETPLQPTLPLITAPRMQPPTNPNTSAPGMPPVTTTISKPRKQQVSIDIAPYLALPQRKAAELLQIHPTQLSRKFTRATNKDRWPNRKITSIRRQLADLENNYHLLTLYERSKANEKRRILQNQLEQLLAPVVITINTPVKPAVLQ